MDGVTPRPLEGSAACGDLARNFGEALCAEFAALLESEHRYDVLEAGYAARACFEQADATFPWPEENE